MILFVKLLASCVTTVRPNARGASDRPRQGERRPHERRETGGDREHQPDQVGVTGRVEGLMELTDLG